MYGKATLAIDVSSSSINAAMVTVTAISQGLTARAGDCDREATSVDVGRLVIKLSYGPRTLVKRRVFVSSKAQRSWDWSPAQDDSSASTFESRYRRTFSASGVPSRDRRLAILL